MLLVLASCSPIVDARGHNGEDADMSQIIEGQSTPEDVTAILGSPSSKSTYGKDTWYYISAKKETKGMFAPEITDQKVVAIRFDDGVVSGIETLGKKDSVPVEMVEKKTPTEGRTMTAIEQMMGNFGRFNAPGKEIDPRNLGRR